MKFEIKHRYSGELLFSIETETMKMAVEAAIKQKADLRYADFSCANLSYADLRYADFSSANLSYADLRSADLRSANLSCANLRSANLSSANLSYADLSYANLSYADLSYADLSSADLRSANLSSADLRSANLSYADLSYATLRCANLLIFQYQRHQAICAGERLTIGCHDKPLAEWACDYEEIGREAGYTDLQIQMYGKFIEMCVEAQTETGGAE